MTHAVAPSGGAHQQYPLLRAILALALVAVIAGLGLQCNAPESKTLRFEIACERFPVATQLSLDLNQQGTQLQGVTADGFLVRATNAETVTLRLPEQGDVALRGGTLTLSLEPTDGPGLNAHVDLLRTGVVQALEVRLESTAELMATTAARPDRPRLTVLSKAKDDSTVTIRGLVVDIVEGNRYRIEETRPPRVFDAFSARLGGSPENIVGTTLISGSRPRTYAALAFAPTSELSLPLLDRRATVAGPSQLEFVRAVNPNLRLDDRRVEGIAADQPVNLAATMSGTTIEELRLVNDADRRGLPALVVSGSGTVHSLLLDGRELMPTRLDEVLNAPVSERTWKLLALGGLAAILLKVLDRALSVLLEYLLPKGA